MKKILTSMMTVAAAALVAFPQTADAGSCNAPRKSYTYVSGYTECGRPIYTKKVFSHYDCRGVAVYKYYKLPVKYKSKRSHQHHAHWKHNAHKRNHYSHHRPYYNHHRPSYSYNYSRGNSCSPRSYSYRFTY